MEHETTHDDAPAPTVPVAKKPKRIDRDFGKGSTVTKQFRVTIGNAVLVFTAPTFGALLHVNNVELIDKVEESGNGHDWSSRYVRRVKKPKPKSRGDRWSEAASDAVAALEALKEVQSEFEQWKENIEERFSGTALYEKLDTICGIDIDNALEAVQEADGAEIPLGFGRD